MTHRDLGLPSRTESWRALRGLRALRPGAAAADQGRSITFQSAIEQSQQFMEAAEGSGYATRPLQLFYALSQGGRAVTAASTLLPTTTSVPDRDNPGQMKAVNVSWQLRGHGIEASGTRSSRIGNVSVNGEWLGLMPGVALALGVEGLVPKERIKLRDLWALIPESIEAPLDPSPAFPVLSFQRGTRYRSGEHYYDNAHLGRIPSRVRDESENDPATLNAFLERYPSLRGWEHPPAVRDRIWQPRSQDSFDSLKLHWRYDPDHPPDVLAVNTVRATRYRSNGDWWVFPTVGSMTRPVHPLTVWWAILFTLSMMARYEPSSWASMIEIDSSQDANAIEHLLDEAMDVIPSLLLEAIHLVAE
jgi:hypothetical protein